MAGDAQEKKTERKERKRRERRRREEGEEEEREEREGVEVYIEEGEREREPRAWDGVRGRRRWREGEEGRGEGE